MSKQFWAIIVVIVLVFVGIVAFSGKNDNGSTGSKATPTNHVEGTSTTGVKLVEYGDYQCPICGLYYSTVKQVAATYTDKITFQFRNLPLTSIHPNAFAGARAAEAAGDQGKYWQMHDMLYENQQTWSSANNPTSFFATYAKSLGLNLTQFNKDYAGSKANNAINADIAAFDKTGDEKATPTFYLNGKKVNLADVVDSNNEPSVDKFSKIIDAAIAAQSQKQ
jgi:protein-disulfide isomerase